MGLLMIETCLFVFLFYCACYLMYKLAWYTVKMLALKRTIKGLNSDETKVIYRQKFKEIVFGKSGTVNFEVITPTERFEVSVLSFISVKGRWNIEKTRNHYYAEARHYNKWFYNMQPNSNLPEQGFDYRRESRFQRKELFLESMKEENVRRILMVYPKPKMLTYTNLKCEYLNSGDKIDGYEVIYAEDFFEMFKAV